MNEPGITPSLPACPACGAEFEVGDQFCEACGALLPGGSPGTFLGASPGAARPPAGSEGGDPDAAAPGDASPEPAAHHSIPTAPANGAGPTTPCVGCGAPPDDIGSDGYCGICGLLQPGPRDHLETDLGWAAGVTDRGRRHPRNEDAFYLGLAGPVAGGGLVAVICDGVSSSVRAEDASEVAATTAATTLTAVASGPGSLADATVHAAAAATRAVAALEWVPTGQLGSPACTLVSAACRAGEVAIGWVGDSRAYWIGPGLVNGVPDDVRRLTFDDSWAEAQVESGRMTEAEADADPRSHAITRWIGADAPAMDAQVTTMAPAGPGRLLLCSDGLWNYVPTVEELAQLLARQPDPATPIELARRLTDFACDAGGHDNITVVVIDLPGADLPGADLPGADLPRADLPRADLPEPTAEKKGSL